MKTKQSFDIHIFPGNNVIFGDINGAQISGASNKLIGNLKGLQAAPISNSAWGSLTGLQISGILNDADSFRGAQCSLFMNLCRDLGPSGSAGVQVGIINLRTGKHVKWYAKAIPLVAVRRPLEPDLNEEHASEPKEKTNSE